VGKGKCGSQIEWGWMKERSGWYLKRGRQEKGVGEVTSDGVIKRAIGQIFSWSKETSL